MRGQSGGRVPAFLQGFEFGLLQISSHHFPSWRGGGAPQSKEQLVIPLSVLAPALS